MTQRPPTPEEIRKMGLEFKRDLDELVAREHAAGTFDKKRFSATRIAKATGIDRSAVSKILSGTRVATPKQMSAIAEALDATNLLPFEVWVDADEHREQERRRQSLPPGLETFLTLYGKSLAIDPEERWHLENSHVKLAPWLQMDTDFWTHMHRFWREFLRTKRKQSVTP